MAKRRKLQAPSAEDIGKLEAEFRDETRPKSGSMAPIASIAAEAAEEMDVVGSETRARLAKAETEAQAFETARAEGLVILEIPLDQINPDAIFRDRMIMVQSELDELRASILRNGLRLPIEVFRTKGANKPFGLLSGYRRLKVMQGIFDDMQLEKFSKIKAIIREPDTSGARFAAVVEENEVRASISHYERGRYAALTVGNGVFENVEAAVDALFPFASKAKRSKVRSFAMIFEEIGDMLQFGDMMTEKQGLRIASALRGGAANTLRDALADGQLIEHFKDEWTLIEDVVERFDEVPRDKSRGGRPSQTGKPRQLRATETDAGIKISLEADPNGGFAIRMKGRGLDRELANSVLAEVRQLLSKPD